jgi:hypothetical protein
LSSLAFWKFSSSSLNGSISNGPHVDIRVAAASSVMYAAAQQDKRLFRYKISISSSLCPQKTAAHLGNVARRTPKFVWKVVTLPSGACTYWEDHDFKKELLHSAFRSYPLASAGSSPLFSCTGHILADPSIDRRAQFAVLDFAVLYLTHACNRMREGPGYCSSSLVALIGAPRGLSRQESFPR